jgi:Undecaprenyl-phosphate galactose phosphotransferase WbaP
MPETPLSSLSMKPLDLEGRPAFQVQYNLLDPWSRRIKRLTDLIICFTSAIVSFPLFLFLALIIRLDSEGPAVFVQKRLGKNGRIFNLYKFRTMEINAEEKLDNLLQKDEKLREEYQKYHKLQNDPRITKMGHFLRKTSLDEFPQIWNVIRGEMSLVGPRAYMPSELEQMGESAVLIGRVLPGLTGWWQVMGRHDVSFQYRLRLDEYYISNFSLWIDFYIMVKTIWVIISGKGA